MLKLVLLMLVVVCVSTTTEQLSVFQTADIVAAHGYPSETHHVTTSDGYILEMHRIPHGKEQVPSANRPVVFLMHGLTGASNAYIRMGPEYAPAYNLADAGFDTWMGNARGNRNSRFHVSLSPDDPIEKFHFFDFTFEEIAIRDLPAMIDYVLQYTGQEKLHYIGHSQGGTTFLILNSMLPEYNDKIQSAHLLAGVGYQDYFPNSELAEAAQLTDFIYSTAVQNGFVEVYPPETDAIPAAERLNYCTADWRNSYMCQLVGVRYLTDINTEADNFVDDIFDDYVSAGAALKQVAHYGQNIRDKSFRRWSYGATQNTNVYGTTDPPAYDLSLITVNTTMHYTVSDDLLDERDVIAMANDMPNASVRKVARETFLHSDFVVANDAKELVTDYIIQALRRDSGLSDSENDEDFVDQNQDNETPPVTDDAGDDSSGTNSASHLVLSHVFVMYLTLLCSSYLFI